MSKGSKSRALNMIPWFLRMLCNMVLLKFKVEILLNVLAPLAEDQTDGPNSNEWDDPEEFVEEQGLMGRVIHMLRSENPG